MRGRAGRAHERGEAPERGCQCMLSPARCGVSRAAEASRPPVGALGEEREHAGPDRVHGMCDV